MLNKPKWRTINKKDKQKSTLKTAKRDYFILSGNRRSPSQKRGFRIEFRYLPAVEEIPWDARFRSLGLRDSLLPLETEPDPRLPIVSNPIG